MKNSSKFKHLIPYALRSIPYILQSHVFKAYCALENLYSEKPYLPQEVWDHCMMLIQDDEPKVKGIIAPSLLDIEEIVDHTSGRSFGPDWILSRGLMPMSYWAMYKKVEEIGFTQVFQGYLEQALEGPLVLGHELSILAGNWQFYADVIAQNASPEEHGLFLQRFTEFVTTTFAQGNDTKFEHPSIDEIPTIAELVKEALHNPGFFGHHVLACVWAQRLQPHVNSEQYQTMLYNLTVLVRWHEYGNAPSHLHAHTISWSESVFDQHLIRFFLQGPVNIHQITLAEVLVDIWKQYPQYRDLVAANILCFTQNTRPNTDS